MTSIIFNDDRRSDEYTSRLRFNAGPDGYAPSQYRVNDASGADYTYSDAASCDSSRSPGYLTCSCRSAGGVESPKTPADGPSRYMEQNRHQQQQQQQQPGRRVQDETG